MVLPGRKTKDALRYVLLLVVLYLAGPYCRADIRDSIEFVLGQLENKVELTGHNDGKEVEMVLASCGLKKGSPYCAATVNWAFLRVGIDPGVKNPAYSPNWFSDPVKVVYKKSWKKEFKGKKAQVFGLFFQNLGRVAHVGFILYETATAYITFEGNTSPSGAIEADQLTDADREAGKNGGFYKKKRSKTQVYVIADYLKDYDAGKKDWRKNSAYTK